MKIARKDQKNAQKKENEKKTRQRNFAFEWSSPIEPHPINIMQFLTPRATPSPTPMSLILQSRLEYSQMEAEILHFFLLLCEWEHR